MGANAELVSVYLTAIRREEERIARAQAEIVKLKEELTDLGWDWVLGEQTEGDKAEGRQ